MAIMSKDAFFAQVSGKLIVSCQALPEEPLHSSFIMSRMALAAYRGGAGGNRGEPLVPRRAAPGHEPGILTAAVGSAIARPMEITQHFVAALE